MDYIKGKCPECGKDVVLAAPNQVVFCSKQCETNSLYRRKRYARSEQEHRITREEARKFLYK